MAVVLAYALILHGVLAGLATAPRAGALGPQPAAMAAICSAALAGHADHPDQPLRAGQHPCALCGLGHCGVPLPPCAALARRLAVPAAAIAIAHADVAVPARYASAPGPRGPPLSA